jgi:1-aminocyclopropane-1-carboxylate deaminase/D-cysteine desulfhydrase-like pyridoxal-dependent ACC family enzyme
VLSLANGARALIEHTTGTKLPHVSADSVVVHHETYGGAYGRETPEGKRAAEQLASTAHITLDPTYSAKAFALALTLAARGPTLFWLTFDSRILDGYTP